METKRKQTKKTPAKPGKPSACTQAIIEQAEKLALLGLTGAQMADVWNVSPRTIYLWSEKNKEFAEALRRGKSVADAQVVKALYQRATGYSHPDVDIRVINNEIVKTELVKHYPPDTNACMNWLWNRQPDLWRNRHEITGKNGGPVETADVSNLELARWMLFMLRSGEVEKNSTKQRKEILIDHEHN